MCALDWRMRNIAVKARKYDMDALLSIQSYFILKIKWVTLCYGESLFYTKLTAASIHIFHVIFRN